VESCKGPAMVGSSLAYKYSTRMEVTNNLAYYSTATIMAMKSLIVKVQGVYI